MPERRVSFRSGEVQVDEARDAGVRKGGDEGLITESESAIASRKRECVEHVGERE